MNIFPASSAQKRLWFLDRFVESHGLYNIPVALRLRGNLNLDALRKALCSLVSRHEALRTCFNEEGGELFQCIHPPANELAVLTDFSGQEGGLERARMLSEEEARYPFDLSTGPLFRSRIVRIADDDHYLLLNMHHIISDGWSLAILLRELQAFYNAALECRDAVLPELPVQYADFACWQNDMLKGPLLERQLDYWRKLLSDSPPLIRLPYDRERQNVQAYSGENVRFDLSLALTDEVREFGRAREGSVFMVMATAMAALLYRYTSDRDICIGFPVANRNLPELEHVVGFFANTLVLRARPEPGKSFRTLFDEIKEQVLNTYDHQDVPFEKLVEELQPERSLAHSPLFQVMLSSSDVGSDTLKLLELRVERAVEECKVAKFDLTIGFVERDRRLACDIEYSVALFNRSTVERLGRHFLSLIEAGVRAPDARIDDLSMLTDSERNASLWRRERIPPREGVGWILDAIATRVVEAPDSIAVECEGESLTYLRLEAEANACSRLLRRNGIGPDRPVAVCLDPSAEAIVCLLGIMKAGGTYLPIAPDLPPSRIRHILEESKVSVVLTHSSLAGRLAAHDNVICIDTSAVIDDDGEPGAHPIAHPLNLAYCIYTSGTTGAPKGVAITFEALVSHIRECNSVYGLGAGDRVLQFASTAFDASLEQILPSLCSGATLVMKGKRMLPPEELAAYLAERCISVADIPTSYRDAAVALASAEGPRPRLVIIGGEPAFAGDLAAHNLPFDMINAYGPTETTITATMHAIGPDQLPCGKYLPIGRPLPDRDLYVLDESLNPVPTGVVGEICIAGATVARGYLHRPGLTAEKFIPDPIRADGSRMFRTGDLAKIRSDRTIEYISRNDSQVKLRGFRIDLGEIESIIQGHRDIALVSAKLIGESDDLRRIVAYVVPVSTASIQVSDLRDHVAMRLPEYMVPAVWVVLEAMPLDRNGKIDRNRLPPPDEVSSVRETVFEAPSTETEKEVADIWAKLLSIPRIGRRDDFFILGGHSLLVGRVAFEVRKRLDVNLPATAIHQTPDLFGLAAAIDRLRERS